MVSVREARVGLCALAPLGAPAVVRAVAEFGPVDVWRGFLAQGEATSWGRRAVAVDLAVIARQAERTQARFVIPGDDEWPESLDELAEVDVAGQAGTPFGLWVRGRPLQQLNEAVAVVGARACTSYGEQVAVTLAADLAAEGSSIISGLAFGIDAAAHRGALGVRGYTVAVVASGVDEPYPSANARLADAVVADGSIVSELPPGVRPTRHAFLARNRLIAALARAVVVVEAANRSGAKNTASWGSALGRHVLAVPGPVTSSMSATPHKLIRDGEAVLASSAADVRGLLAPLGTVPEPTGRGRRRPIDTLAPALFEIREAVAPAEAVSAAQLSARTGQPMMEAMANASELVEAGWLEESGGLFQLPSRR